MLCSKQFNTSHGVKEMRDEILKSLSRVYLFISTPNVFSIADPIAVPILLVGTVHFSYCMFPGSLIGETVRHIHYSIPRHWS